MREFLVWEPPASIDDAKVFNAINAREAAEKFGASYDESDATFNLAKGRERLLVSVKPKAPMNGEDVETYWVYGYYDPVYFAEKIKK